MTQLEKVKREFKKHWNRSMKLKPDGKAWEREMDICEKLLAKGKALYQDELKRRYN